MAGGDRQGPDPQTTQAGRKAGLRLDANARNRIGRGLRLHYASLLAQPLPDRFEALLADLASGTKPEEPTR